MTVRFLTEAAVDAEQAFDWYEAERQGLGAEFVSALSAAVDLVIGSAEAFPMIDEVHRRILLRRFPYALYFRLEGELVTVVALLHVRRSPHRWAERKRRTES